MATIRLVEGEGSEADRGHSRRGGRMFEPIAGGCLNGQAAACQTIVGGDDVDVINNIDRFGSGAEDAKSEAKRS